MRIFISILVVFYSTVLPAQVAPIDSLQHLPVVLINEKAVSQSPDDPLTRTIDLSKNKQYAVSSIAEVFQQSGLLFIKSYGIGSLATASVRGGAASQTGVSWNNIPIQSPMLGLLDLSLLPNVHIDKIGIGNGTKEEAPGSNPISGLIFMSTARPDTSFKLNYKLVLGSFSQLSQSLSLSGGSSSFRYKLSTQVDKAKNDFPYTLRPDLPKIRLPHADFRQEALQQSFFWDFHPKHRLSFHSWQQFTKRNLPPTTVQNRSQAKQSDQSFRQQLHWQARSSHAVWNTRLAFITEAILYEDPLLPEDAPSDFRQLVLKTDRYQQKNDKITLKSGLQYQLATAIANGYRERGQQNQLSAYQSFDYELSPRLQASAALRAQLTENQDPNFAARIQLSSLILTGLQISGSISRDFRVPTLNDLFWVPGGNPDLRTEHSFSQEISVAKGWKQGKQHIALSVYNRKVDDWIQWAQQDGSFFWSAGNVTKVWSRGLQAYGNTQFTVADIDFDLMARYHLTRSTYEIAVLNPAIEKGRQLWYTPVQQAQLQFEMEWKGIQARYIHQYVGKTFGINDDLAAYQLAYLRLVLEHNQKEQTAHFFVEINNLWNENYRVIERRPMPGRHLRCGIQLAFH